MKILHLDDEIWDSGLTEYAISLAQAQHKAGHDCLFAAPASSHAFKKAAACGLQTLNISDKWAGAGKILGAIRVFSPDIINSHTGSAHSFGAFVKLFSASPRPALIRTRADARDFTQKFLSGPLWTCTDGFIGANTPTVRAFRNIYPLEPLSRVVFQGIADAGQAPTDAAQPHTLGLLSRLDPVKGHACAIQALKILREQFPDARLRIAGQQQNVKAEELKKLAASHGLADAVSVEGFVQDKQAFLSGCAIGLVPSLGSEAVSRAALEWMCAGRPVLASAVGGLPDLVEESRTGFLLKPGEPQALAEAAGKLLSSAERMREMSGNARKRYEELFTIEKFAAETYDFYTEVLKRR